MWLRSLCVLSCFALFAACGGGGTTVVDDETGGPGGAGGGGTAGGAGKAGGTAGGGTAGGGTAGGSPGSGGTITQPGTCTTAGTYAGPALTAGAWIDVTGALTGAQRVYAVPKQDKILAAVTGKGLWAYTAAGGAWTKLAGTASYSVSQVEFDPCNTDRFWFSASGGGGGVFLTEDGGATVKKLGNSMDVSGFGVDRKVTNGQVLIAGKPMPWPWGDGKTTVYVSKDGGTTWVDKGGALTAAGATPFGYAYAVDDKTLLVSCMTNGSWDGNNSKGGIWVSKDTGDTWAQGKWVDSAYCAGWAWCGYSNWNQPHGPAAVDHKGAIWWVNEWYNTYFLSKDNGDTWSDEWGSYDHSLAGGGGYPIEVPLASLKTVKTDSLMTDPNIIWLNKKANTVSYAQVGKDGGERIWWADLMPNPADAAIASHDDQLAYDSVANALFLSIAKGAGKYVWMYPF
jgi:hypothetical protein